MPEAAPQTQPILVAMLLQERGTTGVQTHVRNLRDWLAAQGRPAELVTPFDAPGPIRLLLYAFIAIRRVFEFAWPAAAVVLYRTGHAWCLRWALRWRLPRMSAAVVYAQCPVSASVALAMPARVRPPVVLVVHFNETQADEWADKRMISRGGWVYRRIRAFEASVLPAVDGLVFVSRYMQHKLGSRHPACTAIRQAVIPNFVVRPPVPTGHWAYLRADLVSIGTLEPRKNQAYLLAVLAAARQRGQLLTLTLVGHGPDETALKRRAEELGVSSQVRFVGFVPQAAALIHGHLAVVHAARLENLPLALIEAMACGKPAFALPVGGIPELLTDGLNGRHLPDGDPDAAADILCATLRDPVALASMGAAASARFEAQYLASRVAHRLEAFILSTPIRAGTTAPR
jgi:glycosyltransferase involved in cell wall biosynthesis